MDPRVRAVELTEWDTTWLEPGAEVSDSAELIQVTAGTPSPWSNGILRTNLAPGQADARIVAVLAHYRQRDLPFHWSVSPSSRPADLANRLRRHGLQRGDTVRGMVAAANAIRPAVRPGITVEVVTPATAADWVEMMFAGFGIPPEQRERTLQLTLRTLAERQQWSVPVLARYEGAPAGQGTLRLLPGAPNVAELTYTSTHPDLRGRGVYNALVAWRAEHARERGVEWLVIRARRDTPPVVEKLGFREMCRIDKYLWAPRTDA